MNLIVWLVVGGVVGWLASIIMKRDASQGIILNVIVGIVGALLAGWLISPLVGAIILLAIVNLFTRGRTRA